MNINLTDLTPIKVRSYSNKSITLNSSGLYISRQYAEEKGMHLYKHIVFFEHTDNSFVLIGYADITDIPITLREYTTTFKIAYGKDDTTAQIPVAYKVHSTELVRKYKSGGNVTVEDVTVGNTNGFLIRVQ